MKNIITILCACLLIACQQTKEEKLDNALVKLRNAQKKLALQKREVELLAKEVQKLGGKNLAVENLFTIITTTQTIRKDFQQYVDFQGKVVADQSVMVSPESGGLARQVIIEEGQFVKKGQVIAYLDNQMLKDNIQELNSALELANQVYERQKNLWDQKIGTELQFLQAKNTKENIEKKIKTMQNQAGKSVVYAPISGVVDMVLVKTGEMSAPGMPIAKITNLATIKVEAEISENYIGKFKRGDLILLRFPSINKEQTARITNITQFINPGNRTFKVQAEIENDYNNNIVPNMVAVVSLKEKNNTNAIVVPTRLIQQAAEGEFIMIVDNQNVAKKVNIQSGATHNGETEIISGLLGTETLIDAGYHDVIDGDKVKREKE